MATKKKQEVKEVQEKIEESTVPEVLRNNFMPYAMSVIVSRAIPEIDGLKPSHRKVLYTMYEMGLLNGGRTKSANIAARTLLLNPHSDQAQYETMVRLTQNNETLLTPLVDGKGSFGKHYSRDMAFASQRYTEAKLMPIAGEFFKSIKKDTVDFVDNYDATRKEPVLLPVTFPNILANPTEGIAVGMASSIPSFNLSELCDATILRIQHPKKDLYEVMPGPDFTTGGLMLSDAEAISEIYKTGRGAISLRAKYTVDTKARIIEVNEIPYTTTAEAIMDGIITLIKAGKITEISDVRNEIGLQGFKLAIDYKRNVNPDTLMKKLYKLTKLQDSYSCNLTVLINGKPQLLGVVDILDEWIKWRRECVKRELTFDYNKKSKELHLLEGLAKVLLDIDKAIKIIRKTEKDEDVIPNLMKGFKLTEEQAIYVSEIKLRNLNKDYILNKTKAIEQLKEEIGQLKEQLSSEKEINKLIVKSLKEIQKKYGIPRKTKIVKSFAEYNESTEVVADYPVNVYITNEGYVKKIPLTSIKTNSDIKLKEGDFIVNTFNAMNSEDLLVFTDKQSVYKAKLSTIKDSKPSDIADYISNICELESGETVIYACTTKAGDNLIIGFEDGKVAKFPLSVYNTKQNRKKLINAFSSKSRVIGIFTITSDVDFALQSTTGKMMVFNSSLIPLKTTKTTQGVQTLRTSKGVLATSLSVADEEIATTHRVKSIPSSGKVYRSKSTTH